MVKSKLRYYTYKITFKDLPKYFYYGRHKDKGKPYFGTPKTWRHLWDFFEPEVQILQWYETELEAKKNEKKIIDATWRDKHSLNEHNTEGISEDICVRNGERAREEGFGIFSLSPQERRNVSKRSGNKTLGEGIGIFAQTSEDLSRLGKNSFREKKGCFSMSKEERTEVSKRAGGMNTPPQKEGRKRAMGGINNLKMMCTVTGYIGNPGNVARHQKKMGIDPSNRIHIGYLK